MTKSFLSLTSFSHKTSIILTNKIIYIMSKILLLSTTAIAIICALPFIKQALIITRRHQWPYVLHHQKRHLEKYSLVQKIIELYQQLSGKKYRRQYYKSVSINALYDEIQAKSFELGYEYFFSFKDYIVRYMEIRIKEKIFLDARLYYKDTVTEANRYCSPTTLESERNKFFKELIEMCYGKKLTRGKLLDKFHIDNIINSHFYNLSQSDILNFDYIHDDDTIIRFMLNKSQYFKCQVINVERDKIIYTHFNDHLPKIIKSKDEIDHNSKISLMLVAEAKNALRNIYKDFL